MKHYLYLLLTTSVLSLSACGSDENKTEPPQQHTATSETTTSVNVPAECAVTVGSNDAMQFDTKEIQVKSSCKQFAITLKHNGEKPKTVMGHNIVVSKAADKDAVAADGIAATENNHYIKPNDARVLVSTKLIGGGESDTALLNVSKLGKNEEYAFFCTFPGHANIMNGVIKLVD